MHTLISLLRKLGFHINWSKVEGPTQTLTFLGIHIDAVNMCLTLPREKLLELRAELSKFANRKRA